MARSISGGLLTDIHLRATASELAQLDLLFTDCRVEWFKRVVKSPGDEIHDSMTTEDFNDGGFRDKYQERFLGVLKALLHGKEQIIHCCDHHRGLFSSIRLSIAKGENSWLLAFLKLLWARSLDLQCQFPSDLRYSVADGKPMLSRFMLLTTFLANHTSQPPTRTGELLFQKALSWKLSRASRRKVRDQESFGPWHGQIGSYPTFIGLNTQYAEWCQSIKPFASLTTSIDRSPFKRTDSPDAVLRKLGIPFARDQYWIELIYSLRDASIFQTPGPTVSAAIPTQLDGSGADNWAFRPDRGGLRYTNFARDLENGGRGFEELVHKTVAVRLLDDFIVWALPTVGDWAEPSSIYV